MWGIRVEERCTHWLTLLRCRNCTTEISFEPGTHRVAGIRFGPIGVRELTTASRCAYETVEN